MWFTAFGTPISCEATDSIDLPELSDYQKDILNQLIEKRLNNTPLAHLTGRQRFMGIDFICDKRALIPRKETEILGWRALKLSIELAKLKQRINIIDVCCGGGNLGLSIAFHNLNAKVYSTDISNEAVDLTIENISYLKLHQRVCAGQGDLFSSVDHNQFHENTDIIVCNPPYISGAKVKNMNPEISENEPVLAFDGGMFGTKIIQRLIVDAPIFLQKKGWLIFEVGVGQGEFIIQLCQKSKRYDSVEYLKDHSGNIRVILVRNKQFNMLVTR